MRWKGRNGYPDDHFSVVLRHPIERFLSWYKFLQARRPPFPPLHPEGVTH